MKPSLTYPRAKRYAFSKTKLVFLGVIGLFAAPLAKVALLTPFSGLSYAFDAMVSYAAGPLVADLPAVLAALYGIMLVAFVPCAIRSFRGHQVT